MQRFFAPGRTELAGNHTDHQLGRVLAASVDVGITARATRRRDRLVCIHSKGFRPFTVVLDDLAVDPRAYGKPWALVRGMAAAILDAGGEIGGFEAWASSALKPGGGLSSSAAFEILVGRSNAQNDELTTKTARRTDIWLHTKTVHGSHVIISCDGLTPPEKTIEEAASLAVFYSQARDGGKTQVDYTMVRNVRKPSGSLPGKVIYTDYSTVSVSADEVLAENLRVK